MAASILKAISLILLFVINLAPVTAAIPVTEVLRPFSLTGINTPDAFREQWLRTYPDNQDFGLLNPYPNGPVAIGAIMNHARMKTNENKAWDDFVPLDVTAKIAAVDFLTKAVPVLASAENAILRAKAVASMEDLLTLKSGAVREANENERKVIIAATIRIALELYSQRDNAPYYNFAYWKLYFSQNSYTVSSDVEKTINTRATLAALVISQITNRFSLADIQRDSGMRQDMFINLIHEIYGVVQSYALKAELGTARGEEKTARQEDGAPRTPTRKGKGNGTNGTFVIDMPTSSSGTPDVVRTRAAATDEHKSLLSSPIIIHHPQRDSLSSLSALPALFTGDEPLSRTVLISMLKPVSTFVNISVLEHPAGQKVSLHHQSRGRWYWNWTCCAVSSVVAGGGLLALWLATDYLGKHPHI